jgi:hypothetical protein
VLSRHDFLCGRICYYGHGRSSSGPASHDVNLSPFDWRSGLRMVIPDGTNLLIQLSILAEPPLRSGLLIIGCSQLSLRTELSPILGTQQPTISQFWLPPAANACAMLQRRNGSSRGRQTLTGSTFGRYLPRQQNRTSTFTAASGELPAP